MPIDKNIFDIARDPSGLIKDFLESNPDKAFTIEEILSNVPQLNNLDIPKQKIIDSLDNLTRYGEVGIAFLRGNRYYAYEED